MDSKLKTRDVNVYAEGKPDDLADVNNTVRKYVFRSGCRDHVYDASCWRTVGGN